MEVCLKIPKKQFRPEQSVLNPNAVQSPNFCFLTGENVLVIQLPFRERNLSGAQEKLKGNSISPKKEVNQGNTVCKEDCHRKGKTGRVLTLGFNSLNALGMYDSIQM